MLLNAKVEDVFVLSHTKKLIRNGTKLTVVIEMLSEDKGSLDNELLDALDHELRATGSDGSVHSDQNASLPRVNSPWSAVRHDTFGAASSAPVGLAKVKGSGVSVPASPGSGARPLRGALDFGHSSSAPFAPGREASAAAVPGAPSSTSSRSILFPGQGRPLSIAPGMQSFGVHYDPRRNRNRN